MLIVTAIIFAWTFYNRNLSGRNNFGVLSKQNRKQVDVWLEQTHNSLLNAAHFQSLGSWDWTKSLQEIHRASTLLDLIDGMVPKEKLLNHSSKQIHRNVLRDKLNQLKMMKDKIQ
jgi:hypothetical protein